MCAALRLPKAGPAESWGVGTPLPQLPPALRRAVGREATLDDGFLDRPRELVPSPGYLRLLRPLVLDA